MVHDTFRRFAEDKVRPVAEHIHRHNDDIPEDVIDGLAELGTFGLSIPAEYEGFSEGGEGEYLAMVVATEELSRGSLGRRRITHHPARDPDPGVGQGRDRRAEAGMAPTKWRPAEILNAVAVTEPDYGSDVAGLKVTARPVPNPASDGRRRGRLAHQWRQDLVHLRGPAPTSSCCSPAPIPDPRPATAACPCSLFRSPVARATASRSPRDGGTRRRKIGGRAIDTLGYRGMHSYEVAFEDWWVPAANLIGEADGVGRGFYLQMQGFENGRLQTAARAVGVMQAAYEAAYDYAVNRRVFGKALEEYQLTQVKLARMAVIIQASRQFAYHVARLMAKGEGAMEASLVKAYVCRAAEWVTREAVQIHGGMGYAEEYAVSRYFVDARVLSIFEGADETLALKVIARRLLEGAA